MILGDCIPMQAIPDYFRLFHVFPGYSGIFHCTPGCYSRLFRISPAYSMLFDDIPSYFNSSGRCGASVTVEAVES